MVNIFKIQAKGDNIKFKDLMQILRVILSGKTVL